MTALAEDLPLPPRRFSLATAIRRNPTVTFGAVLLLLLIAVAAIGPSFVGDPFKIAPVNRLRPPSERWWLGTDQFGRDVFTRTVYGARVSLIVGLTVAAISSALGLALGLACGYFGGRFDMVSQRLIEFLQSFPDLILAMAIAMALGGGIVTVIVAIAITRIPFGGRVIRSVVLSLKEMQYVEAARGVVASHARLMFRHILPQCVAPFMILATTHLGVAIVIEASLGFLGVGVPPPTPTWGNMLSDALNAGLVPPWWLVLFPGLAITVTVLAFNLLGDGIRDLLDPRLRGSV